MTSAQTIEEVHRGEDAKEQAVGISVFVRPDVPGFRCILKQRYTDFLVNEVLPNGEILHLADTGMPPERKRKRDANESPSVKKHKPSEQDGQDGIGAHEQPRLGKEPTEDVAAAIEASEPMNASLKVKKEEAVASISDADRAVLRDIFGHEASSSIVNLYAAVIAYPKRKPRDHSTVSSPPILEKSKRTEAHLCVRRIFNSKLETLTVQGEPGSPTTILVKAAPPQAPLNPNHDTQNGAKQQEQRGKENWAELGGEYLHFTLFKENKDTMEVLYFLASQLKMHQKHFGFAGTKDRRGVTVQRVSIHRVKRERMEQLNKLARGWRLGGPWEYKQDGLVLGMSKGNQFALTLRDAHFHGEPETGDIDARLKYAESVAAAAAKSMSTHGFLNYYGLQRFGTHSTGTHAIGMKMLKGDLKGAVDSILSYDKALLAENQSAHNGAENGSDENSQPKKIPYDDIRRATAIHAFRAKGLSGDALHKLPGSRFSAEKGLITHLGKFDRTTGQKPNENDFQGALMLIQRNMRLMYVHAYQSFVWNTIAGKRWEMYGERVVEGDLVVVGEKERIEGVANGVQAPIEEFDDQGEPIIHPSASDDQAGVPVTGEVDDPYVRARPLTREEAESGRYNIFDLVLPLPGFDVIYPKNEIGKFIVDFMASEEGGGLDPYKMRRSWKDISLSGGYRKMMARPLGDIEVEVRAYHGPEEQMIETDLERLEKADASADIVANGNVEKTGLRKDKVAVVLKLQLGSSQYATMALREVTKGGALGFTPSYSITNR